MAEDRFDVVVVGGGHNGSTIAAYLAKSGLSVCVLEARPECGGGQENTEPRPGFRIDPHATYLYGGAAPGFDQLELWKYGFRLVGYASMSGVATLDGAAANMGSRWRPDIGEESLRPYMNGGGGMRLVESLDEPAMRELLRALFWTPPHPSGYDVEPQDMPWWQVFRKYLPEIWSPQLLDMSYCDFLEEFVQWEPQRVLAAMGAWYCGAHPNWDGMLLPSLGGTLLFSYSSGSPRGGMHSYAHAIIRCALAHGARMLTNAPVEEIIVRNGRAVGVRLAEDAAWPEKTIWADKAVISGVDVKQTFLRLVGKRHLDVGFSQRVDDVSLKGGSLFVMSVICRELPKYHGRDEWFPDAIYPSCVVAPADSMEFFHTQTRDAYSYKHAPAELTPEHLTMMICQHDVYDSTRCPEGYHVLSPIYLECPPPQYDVTGPEGYNRQRDEITKAALALLERLAPNMHSDNILDVFVNTPQDSEFRNAGMSGGNWYGARQSEDQWFGTRPLPELARYRTPIDGLYLCSQTSHPGGLCLMAVPYNLMHILIEDRVVEPASWWYPSSWYVPENGARQEVA